MCKVLIVDDERALRILVKGTLELENYKIMETDNGIDALDMVNKDKPDLIILDVMMPGMTGYEVCHQIKENPELKGIKILMLSAKGQQKDKEAAEKAMADNYLSKPFSPARLLEMVKDILGEG